MDYVPHTQEEINEMLKTIGIDSIDQLLKTIPQELQELSPMEKDGLSEWETFSFMERLGGKNTFLNYDHYLGGGAYDHFVPAVVDAIISRSEFLTSYTPYQAEASQGLLQAMFEYQSSICSLTKKEVANASVYDAASSCAEGVLMSLRVKHPRQRVLIAESVSLTIRQVIDQYLEGFGISAELVPFKKNGQLDLEDLSNKLDEQVACLLIASPNYFGQIESMKQIEALCQKKEVLLLHQSHLMAYALFEPRGDIAVGDTQAFGMPLQFGGPYAGYIACKKIFIRQLPGRIVGKTEDTNGKEGYVLTLQAREQHIRREKATSNICTNQALAALATLVSLYWYGPQGVKEVALANFQRASYLKEKLCEISGIKPLYDGMHFNEFVLQFSQPIDRLLEAFKEEKLLPGIPLEKTFSRLKNTLLVTVTEKKSMDQLKHFIEVARRICG